ncbi:MAG: RloB family protein [Bacteroidales bacterium]
MPREPIPLIRPGGFLQAEKLYILAFEGEKSEYKYFNDFRESKYFNDSGLIETISLKRPKKRGSDPLSVKKLLKEAKESYPFKKNDEFWLIIDRDHWENIHNVNFVELAEDCKREKNFYLALSNPCFEIWLLLHLTDISAFSLEDQKKIFLNEKISSSKNYIDGVLGDLIGRGYNKIPNPKVFLPHIYKAIARAKLIDKKNSDYPKTLGTYVYKLVEKLVKINPIAL